MIQKAKNKPLRKKYLEAFNISMMQLQQSAKLFYIIKYNHMLNKNTFCEEVWCGGGGTGVFCSLN